ncbi:hypothetical protein CC80DRAFT_545818 [Byssothecium circinans]|uniref:DUF7730 domain-containing protein n=1 Tax=Byssothecium circinans TaxID=147558 RepID=A0A6A5U3I4_9PLEO|nr:hypothetical protein CC80DRAFT_545818 [Byssothecium circinans]
MARVKRKRGSSLSEHDPNTHVDRKKSLRTTRPMPEVFTQYNQLHSPLLRLPGEIRNKIYEYALGGLRFEKKGYGTTRVYAIEHPGNSKIAHRSVASMALSLTKVCRQVHAETALLPYQLNAFPHNVVFDKSSGYKWDQSDALEQHQREAIKTITVPWEFVYPTVRRQRLFTPCINLSTLIVQDTFHYCIHSLGHINHVISSIIGSIGQADLNIHLVCPINFRGQESTRRPSLKEWQRIFLWKAGKIYEIQDHDYNTKVDSTYREDEAGTWCETTTGEIIDRLIA